MLSGLVIDFGQEMPRSIFNEFSGISPAFSFVDGFLVNCSLSNGQQFAVNLRAKKDVLIKNKVFDSEGKCLLSQKIYSKPFFELSAKDLDGDGTAELIGCQSVVLSLDETELFKIYSVQKYINSEWYATKIEVKY